MNRHLDSPTSLASTRTATIVVADHRPVMRAGLAALASEEASIELAASCDTADVSTMLDQHLPSVLVTGIAEHDTDPFQAIATAKALHPGIRILVVADATSVLDLREAVVAGVDSLLLSTATLEQLRDAVTSTARGERVVSPDVAMQLASARYDDARRSSRGGLTPRELEVLQILAEGRTNAEIAGELGLSARTVKTHVQNLLAKLETPDRTGAVAQGFRQGLIR